jgi:oligopeptide/dipeptide ABC transporter ATP-binding protein
LIICDEPISSLDVSVQAQVMNLLQRLKAERHLSMLFISHDLRAVRHIADRIAVMYLGKIVELASVEELIDAPMHPYTAALLSAAPALKDERPRPRLQLKGDLPSPAAVPGGCRFSTRCWLRTSLGNPSICSEHEPTLLSGAPDGTRLVACHFSDSLSSAAPVHSMPT